MVKVEHISFFGFCKSISFLIKQNKKENLLAQYLID